MSFACDAYVLGSGKVEVVEKEPRFFSQVQYIGQGSKFSFRQTCPAGQVLPKIHSSLRKIYLPCFSAVKMKKS